MSEEQYQKKKKTLLLSIFCTIAIILGIGISYAFWQKTKVQNNPNVIASKCFDIELSGNNAIDLGEAYPLSNEEGMQTIPFTFTVKNICDYKTAYTVNLESLATTTFQNSSIKVAIDDNYKLYSGYTATDTYFEDSKEARILASGVLTKNQTKTYNLRLWIDENAPVTEQSKTFECKIIVNAALANEKTIESTLKIGDYISMTPTSTSYTLPNELSGCDGTEDTCIQNTIDPSELNLWRVIRKNDDGTVDVVSEYVSSTEVKFFGQVGYMNLVGGLNTIAAQYTNEKYVQSTRHMGYSNQTEKCTTLEECPSDTGYEIDTDLVNTATGTMVGKTPSGTANTCWLASRYFDSVTDVYGRNIDIISSGLVYGGSEIWSGFAVRPILTLKADIKIASGDGKSADTAYQLK